MSILVLCYLRPRENSTTCEEKLKSRCIKYRFRLQLLQYVQIETSSKMDVHHLKIRLFCTYIRHSTALMLIFTHVEDGITIDE